MKNKRDKKELTRLILTALILGSGCLYGTVAEATDPKVVDENMTTINASNNTYKMTCDTSNKYVTGNGNPMYVPIIINGVNNGTNGLTAYSFYGEYAHSTSASGFGNITLNGGTLNNFAGCYNGVNGAFYNKAYIHHNVGTGTVYNDVTVNGDVYGGHSSGNVTNNTVEINQQTGKTVTVTGNVYGGKSTAANAGTGQGTGNSVTINGGNIVGSIYGGYSDSKDAFNNSVTLGGTTTKKITIGGNVVGGRAGHGQVTDSNSVILQGTAQVAGYMYGGARRSDSSSDDVPINIISGYNDGNVLYLDGSAQGNIVTGTVAGFTNFVIKNNFTFKPNTTSASAILKAGTMNVNFLDFYNNASTLRNDTDSAGTMTLLLSDTNMGGNFYIFPDASKSTMVTLQAGIAGKDTYNVTSFSGAKYYTNPSDHNNSLVLTHSGTHVIKYPDQKHLNYVITNNLTAVDLSKWDGTTATVPTGWTKGISAVSVSGTVPSAAVSDVTAGNSKDILTTTTSDLFTGATGLPQSTTAFSENLATGVDITGNKVTGVQVTDSGKKLTYYNAAEDKDNMTGVTLGAMTWGQAAASASGYKFTNTASINDSNLSFTFTDAQKVALNQDSSMTLLTGATNLAASTGASREQNITSSTTNGAALSGTLKGKVSSASGTVTYNVDSMTLNNIDLKDWDGSAGTTGTAVGNLPSGWTKPTTGGVTVDTGNFTVTPSEKVDIFTTTTEDFFGAVTGARAYDSTGTFNNEVNGVTLAGTRGGGVKAENNGTIANAKLTYYAEKFDVNTVSLGQMEWRTPRAATAAYDFSGVTNIDASNLTFDDTTKATALNGSTNLLTGATSLAASPTITPPTSASVGVEYTDGKNIKYSGNSTSGDVEVSGTDVTYTITGGKLDNINLDQWDGTQPSAIPTGWTSVNDNVSVTANTFGTDPTGDVTIFDTDSANFFGEVTGAKAYTSGPFTDKLDGVTLSGTKAGGVKTENNGADLVYKKEVITTTGIGLEGISWSKGNTARTVGANYGFADTGTVDTSQLSLGFSNATDATSANKIAKNDTMTFLEGTNGPGNGWTVSGSSTSQDISYDEANGAKLSGKLTGTVSVSNNKVNYTVNGKSLDKVELGNWDGTSAVNVDTSWTAGTSGSVAVDTGSFAAPSSDKNIMNLSGDLKFGTVTGDRAYKDDTPFNNDEEKGVTLSGTISGGVKASDDGKQLNYFAQSLNPDTVTLGTMTWGTGRAIGSGYNFAKVGDNSVDASGLSFNFTGDTVNTVAVGDDWNLLTGATNLKGGLTVKGTPATQTISYGIDNVATLKGSLTGKVTTMDNTVHYAVTGKTLDSVDVSSWNGTASGTVDDSWNKKSAISVTGSVKAIDTLGDHDILTAGSTGYFTGAQIGEDIQYQGHDYSETESKITLSGTQNKGVQANDDGSKLVYTLGTADINSLKLGSADYVKGGTLLDKSDDKYNFTNLKSLDTSDFKMSMTDDQKKVAQINDSMTLVKGNDTLGNLEAQETETSSYTYNANEGLMVRGTVSTSLSAKDNKVLYSITDNKGTGLSFSNVTWDTAYARPDEEVNFKDAAVDASHITFSGTDKLSTGDVMTLVSNFGDSVNKTRAGIFTLDNGKTGKGHAYWDSATKSLMYVVDRGVDEQVAPVEAVKVETTIDGENPHKGDVPGGKAEGDGEAKDNETKVKNSHIQKNDDGTGGDANGGTSENGDADNNKLDVEDSEIDGDANGGQSDTGNTEENEVIIKRGTIHGTVTGGETLGGHGGSKGNTTTVKDSTVDGDVNGGKTGGSGNTEENHVILTGSKVGGDVNGGHSGGSGGSNGNETTLDGTEVGGDVNGGKTDGDGETKENKVDIKNGSKIGGNVTGGRSGGNGDSTDNETTVEGKSQVDGDVTGGQSEKGNANKNETTVTEGSKVGGDVTGGKSNGDGTSNENKTTVSGGSEIGGNVVGGHSKNGDTNQNETTVTGGSKVEKDVIGGQNEGKGTSNENKATVDGSTVGGNVTGGQSESGNTSKNETKVSGKSKVTGDVTGGKTNSGTSSENKATVEGGSEVGGSVVGGQSENGDTNKNETSVTGGSKVDKNVIGGQSTGNGAASENKAIVDGSTVGDSVTGGQSEGGNTDKNEATVTGKSKVTNDVTGGKTKGNGTSNENKANVAGGSEIGGSVTGGLSESGSTNKNEVSVTDSSTVAGDVTGGKTGGEGTANENKATVSGSTVTGSVAGGQSENGNTNQNEVSVTAGSIVNGSVAGGKTTGTGSADNNTVSIDSSTIKGSLSGGDSNGGSASGNTVTVKDATIGTETTDGNIYGGKTAGVNKPADTNTVSLTGGKVNGGVFGGYSENGSAANNKVTVNGTTIRDYIYGGKSKYLSQNDGVYFKNGSVMGIIGGGCEESLNNLAELSDGTVEEHVLGGFATGTDGIAKGNRVQMTGGTVKGSVIGGYGNGTADGNTIYLGGGTVNGADIDSKILNVGEIKGGVYGGYGTGSTKNNSVYLYGTADVSNTALIGGTSEATGNLLNIGYMVNGTATPWTGGAQSVKDIKNFENMSFSVVPWSTSQAGIKITEGTNSDLSMTTVSANNVEFTGVKAVAKDDTMTLLDQSAVTNKAVNVNEDSAFTIGIAVEGTGKVALDEKGNVVYNVKDVRATEQTHNVLMGAEATMTVLNVGNDYIGAATDGLALPVNTGTDGVASFAKLGGGKLTQETGSHIDVSTWNAILAVGHKNVKKQSSFEYGAFFEYGNGNYTTFNDATQPGDGSTRYTGGGLLAKWYAPKGFYVEGSLRAGTVHEDANNLLRDSMNNAYGYKTDTNYFGFHVGVGRELKLDKNSSLDVYAKYFYNRRNGTDFTVDGADYSLDAITSSLVRVGARYTERNDRWNFYGGLAYEYEMDGKATGRVNGIGIRGADIGGGRVRGEIGTFMRPSADNPWGVDLNLTCFVGKKQGVMGSVSVAYTF